GRIMAQAAEERPGGMIAIVGLEEPQVEAIRSEVAPLGALWVANRNADVQFALSGELPAIQAAERLALARGARRALTLTIPLPAHSPLMDQAAAAFRAVVEKLPLVRPEWPVLANASGEAMRTVEAL